MKQAPNSFVLRCFSKNDFWARLQASWPNFMRFVAQNNQKGLFFPIQLEKMMSKVCKAQTNNLKTLLYVLSGSSQVSEACSESKNVSLGII